jgi:CTP:molybdopterin cytidylyltransferase MocA
MTTVALMDEMKTRLRDASIVLCDYSKAKGPPALFHRKHLEELMALQGDRGAKAVAANYDIATVTFADGAWDIDSPEKWEEFLAIRLISGQTGSDG